MVIARQTNLLAGADSDAADLEVLRNATNSVASSLSAVELLFAASSVHPPTAASNFFSYLFSRSLSTQPSLGNAFSHWLCR